MMKILVVSILGFVLTSCQGSDLMKPQPKANEEKVEDVQERDAVSRHLTEEVIIQEIEISETRVEVPQTEEEELSMSQQVAAVFTEAEGENGEKLSEEQAAEGHQLTMNVIKAANSGNPFQMAAVGNEMIDFVNEASSNQLGVVDVAGVVDGVLDLIDAALDLDVAGIIDALLDIVDAILD